MVKPNKDSSASHRRAMKLIELSLWSIGFNVFERNYKWGLWAITMYVCILSYYACTAYTATILWSTKLEVLKCFCCTAVPIAVSKLICNNKIYKLTIYPLKITGFCKIIDNVTLF